MNTPFLGKKTVLRVSGRNQFKYENLLMMLTITIFIMCDTTAFRPTIIFGNEVPLSGLILPVVFALSDVISEVYGLDASYRLIKAIIICQLLYSFGMYHLLSLESPIGNSSNIHYSEAFKNIRWTSFTSCFSIPTGMYINTIILNYLKIKDNGNRTSFRGIVSGASGELVICIIAYNFLFFWENKLYSEIFNVIFTVWIYRLFFTILTIPLFVATTRALKYLEGKEVFDRKLYFNPFGAHKRDYEANDTANDALYG